MKSHCVHNTLHRQFCSSLNVTSFLKSFPCNPEQWRNCNICIISVDYCILSRCLSNLSCVYCFTWNILYSVFVLMIYIVLPHVSFIFSVIHHWHHCFTWNNVILIHRISFSCDMNSIFFITFIEFQKMFHVKH